MDVDVVILGMQVLFHRNRAFYGTPARTATPLRPDRNLFGCKGVPAAWE
jgi:hypothetical protein